MIAEAMAGEYTTMILGLQWIIGLKKTSQISSEIAAEFGFFPVSTKVKAQWACANIFRRLKSYIILFLYLFGNLLLLREDPSENLESMETSVERPSRWLWRDFTVSIDKLP